MILLSLNNPIQVILKILPQNQTGTTNGIRITGHNYRRDVKMNPLN